MLRQDNRQECRCRKSPILPAEKNARQVYISLLELGRHWTAERNKEPAEITYTSSSFVVVVVILDLRFKGDLQ